MAPALLLALVATQLAGKTLEIDPERSALRFHVEHRFHGVTGTAKQVEAKAAVGADGKVLAMVRVPVASLDSGDANRDANMREVLEVARYPFVVYKGIGQLPGDLSAGAPVEVALDGELDLHGVKRRLEIPVLVELADDGAVRVRGSARLSLDAYGIERPSLLFIKIEDGCRIDLDLVMREAGG